MNHVFARVKGKSRSSFFKLLSDKSLFNTLTVNTKNCIPYAPDHNLDEDSWYKIDNFTTRSFCLDILKDKFDSKDYSELKKDQFLNISYIFGIQGADFYFQKIRPSLFINKKMIIFGEVAEIDKTNMRLVINENPDAIFYKKTDTLIFRNLAAISSIFKGIDILYKEATDQEVEEFMNSSFITINGNYGADTVSKSNRKRIALVINTLSNMSEKDKANMHTYINEYCKDKIKYDKTNSKYDVSCDEELKYLLYGIEQRFYTTPFSKEKRLANSVIAFS